MYSGQVVRSLKDILVCEMSRVLGKTPEQKKILWENALNLFNKNEIEYPEEIKAMLDKEFEENLGYDELFCSESGIDYAEIDRHWDDIRAAIALRYHDYYSMDRAA